MESVMYARPARSPILAGFVSISPATHEFLPRATRKALRVVRPLPIPQTYTNWDADDAHSLRANTVDPDFDLDGAAEFSDSDGSEDLHGLTIVNAWEYDFQGYSVL
jgi:hypothetical protein